MDSLFLEEEDIIKYIRSIFGLKKTKSHCIKEIRNLFRQEKETKAIKDRILRAIKILFDYEEKEENFCKPVRLSNFWSNNYIEYKSNGDRNKALLFEEYPNKSRPYLKDIINKIRLMENSVINIK